MKPYKRSVSNNHPSSFMYPPSLFPFLPSLFFLWSSSFLSFIVSICYNAIQCTVVYCTVLYCINVYAKCRLGIGKARIINKIFSASLLFLLFPLQSVNEVWYVHVLWGLRTCIRTYIRVREEAGLMMQARFNWFAVWVEGDNSMQWTVCEWYTQSGAMV